MTFQKTLRDLGFRPVTREEEERIRQSVREHVIPKVREQLRRKAEGAERARRIVLL